MSDSREPFEEVSPKLDSADISRGLRGLSPRNPWNAKQPYSYFRIYENSDTYRDYLISNMPEGEGNYGRVYKAWQISKQGEGYQLDLRAVKSVDAFPPNDEKIFKAIQREAAGLRCIYPETDAPIKVGAQIFLVTKFIHGQSLVDERGQLNPTIQSLPLSERFALMIAIATAVKNVHDQGWVHRDVSGQNIKFTLNKKGKPEANLIDFGLARAVDDKKSNNEPDSPGTPGYMAPERVMNEGVSMKGDVLSLVPIFALILGAKNPIEDKLAIRKLFSTTVDLDKQNQAEMLVPFNYKGMLTEHGSFASAMTAFFDKMSSRDEEQRPDMQTVLDYVKQAKQFHDDYLANLKPGLFSSRVSKTTLNEAIHSALKQQDQASASSTQLVSDMKEIMKQQRRSMGK